MQSEFQSLSPFPMRDLCFVAPVVTVTEKGYSIQCPICQHVEADRDYETTYKKWAHYCEVPVGRIMTPDEQLAKWVEGNSVHNGVTRGTGECCPDFSCCMPGAQWPEERRRAFAAADDESRFQMLFGGLKGLLDYNEVRNVHVTD